MKRILITVWVAFFLVSCATERGTNTGGPDSSSGVAVGSGGQAVPAQDSSFARQACQAGVAEVEIAKLAARNTRNREVRALARRIAEEHARAEKELGKLFARKGVPPEQELAPDFRNSLERLAGLKGAEFDHAFKQQVIDDHENAIELFEKQAEHGADPDFRAFAQKHLPHLREHLAMAQRLELAGDRRTEPEPGAVDVLANPATRTNLPR